MQSLVQSSGKPLPTNGRPFGRIVGSLVMAEYQMEIEELECSFHNLSVEGTCTQFGVFDSVHFDVFDKVHSTVLTRMILSLSYSLAQQ